jgi:putative ABC transport system ATP-binding protein
MDKAILIADKVSKKYISGTRELTVLDAASFSVDQGEQCAIVGPSGSGKTTLLGLCAGLDQASSGSIMLHGVNLNQMSEDQRAAIRNEHVGFVFQQFNLLAGLTAVENVMIPMELKKMKSARSKALELLEAVGLADRAGHYPAQLSGGEQQRVSIARAFANEPSILFADEPTGNLDEETGAQIESLLFEMNRMHGTTLVVVTHDMELARKTGRMLRMKGGKLFDELRG